MRKDFKRDFNVKLFTKKCVQYNYYYYFQRCLKDVFQRDFFHQVLGSWWARDRRTQGERERELNSKYVFILFLYVFIYLFLDLSTSFLLYLRGLCLRQRKWSWRSSWPRPMRSVCGVARRALSWRRGLGGGETDLNRVKTSEIDWKRVKRSETKGLKEIQKRVFNEFSMSLKELKESIWSGFHWCLPRHQLEGAQAEHSRLGGQRAASPGARARFSFSFPLFSLRNALFLKSFGLFFNDFPLFFLFSLHFKDFKTLREQKIRSLKWDWGRPRRAWRLTARRREWVDETEARSEDPFAWEKKIGKDVQKSFQSLSQVFFETLFFKTLFGKSSSKLLLFKRSSLECLTAHEVHSGAPVTNQRTEWRAYSSTPST